MEVYSKAGVGQTGAGARARQLGPDSERRGERGAVAVLMAVSIVAIIMTAAFAIDMGAALVTQAELQNAADAGSLAAVHELGEIYGGLGDSTAYKTYTLTSADEARLLAKAVQIAGLNTAGNQSVGLLGADLVTGTYDPATGDLSPTKTGVRAISLRTRRDDSMNEELPTMLARVMGIDAVAIASDSTAALTALGTLKAGKGDIPIGISEHWFDSGSCQSGDNSIRFYPTGSLEGCASWHTYTDWPASSSRLRNIIDGLEDGSFSSPETTAGQTSYNFIGGTVASRVDDFKDLYDSKKDGAGEWTVTIPVYQASDCTNPNGAILIVGFARATIYDVQVAPSKTVMARVECGLFDADDLGDGGGGEDYGTLVSSPLLIK